MGAAKVQGQTKFWLSQVSILAFKIGQKTWLVATQLLEEFWWFLLLSVPWLLSYFIFMVSIYNLTVTHCSKPRIFVQKINFCKSFGSKSWFLAGHTVPKLHFLSKKSTLRKNLNFDTLNFRAKTEKILFKKLKYLAQNSYPTNIQITNLKSFE